MKSRVALIVGNAENSRLACTWRGSAGSSSTSERQQPSERFKPFAAVVVAAFNFAGGVPHAGSRRRLADPNPAHTRDDRRRDNAADCDARAPKTICGASIDTVRDQHHPQSRRKVA
jgi:hypothetical protein